MSPIAHYRLSFNLSVHLPLLDVTDVCELELLLTNRTPRSGRTALTRLD